MVQKEVAERIASKHGNKTYGILSVILQAFYDIEYLFTVSEQVFLPPPKVKSAVIRLTRNKRSALPCSETLFVEVVKAAFNQRRKMMRNSLKGICENLPDKYADKRPEQLSVIDFIDLTTVIENIGKGRNYAI
jgi:16S rRNA (adenine1518-N6/adenine1519-N6)-dimethyltransferase